MEEAEMKPIGLTRHGAERLKQRVGEQSGKTIDEQAEVAYRCGLRRKDLNGKLYRWVERRCYQHPGKIARLHRGYLYFYGMDAPHQLVTVFPVPKDMRNQAKRLERRKRKGGEIAY